MAVSVNDIIIKLVATTLKVSTVHRLFVQHVSILEQYTYIYTRAVGSNLEVVRPLVKGYGMSECCERKSIPGNIFAMPVPQE